MGVWLFGIGLVSLLGQVVLLRELLVSLYGSELVAILALALWMISTAMGALAGNGRRPPGPAVVPVLLLASSLVLPGSLVFVRASRHLMGGVPGAFLPFPRQVILAALALVPLSFLMGLAFRKAASAAAERGRSLAWAYAAEAAGSVAGGLLATGFLAAGVTNAAACVMAALAAAVAASLGPRPRPPRPGWATAAVAVLGLLALSTSGRWNAATTAWDHPALEAVRDTPYGRMVVERRQDQVAVFANGTLCFDTEGTSAEAFVHPAAVQCADPRAVLILGGAAEGLAAEVLKHGPSKVDVVEPDEAAFDLLRPRLSTAVAASLSDARVALHFGDPRRFVRGGGSYDLLLVGMPEPGSAEANRFYTREFFALCRGRLARGGVLALRLGAPENFWTRAALSRLSSIVTALRETFGDVLVLPGGTSVIVASDARLTRDPNDAVSRWASRGVMARLVSAHYLRYLLTSDRLAEVRERLASVAGPANTDGRPVCYRLTMALWLSRFYGAGAPAGPSPRPGGWVWLWGVAALAFILPALSGRNLGGAPILVAAWAGFAGMAAEAVWLLRYQASQGVLYRDLGLLLMLFMGGLAAGAWLVERASGGADSHTRIWGTAAAVLLAASALVAAAWTLPASSWASLASAGLGLLSAGAGSGGLFAAASLGAETSHSPRAGVLYASDLAGGCVACLAGGLLLIPAAGLSTTALLAAAAAAGCLAPMTRRRLDRVGRSL